MPPKAAPLGNAGAVGAGDAGTGAAPEPNERPPPEQAPSNKATAQNASGKTRFMKAFLVDGWRCERQAGTNMARASGDA
jgi:hypothetical protein